MGTIAAFALLRKDLVAGSVGFLALLDLVAVACSDGRPRAEPVLAGPVWQLVAIRYSDGTSVVPDDPAKYTLQFETEGRVLVRADCNRGAGAWKAEGASLTLGPVGMTRMACPPDSLFDRYTRALDAVASYVLGNGTLHVAMGADGGILEFRPVP